MVGENRHSKSKFQSNFEIGKVYANEAIRVIINNNLKFEIINGRFGGFELRIVEGSFNESRPHAITIFNSINEKNFICDKMRLEGSYRVYCSEFVLANPTLYLCPKL